MQILIFWEDGFPCVDAAPVSREMLQAALAGHEVCFVSAAGLPAALAAGVDLLVTPYGSAFPVECWTAFTAYLRSGGGWVNLGGAPVSVPVRRTATGWEVEPPQRSYGKQLRIIQVFPVAVPATAEMVAAHPEIVPAELLADFRPTQAWGLMVRLTDNQVFPGECGSQGLRDALVTPLAHAVDGPRVPAAPLVAFDWHRAPYAGGRWVFAACDGPLPGALITRLCEYAMQPRLQVEIAPSFACYIPGEAAALTARVACDSPQQVTLNVRIWREGETDDLLSLQCHVQITDGPVYFDVPPVLVGEPGLYLTELRVEAADGAVAVARNGFWGYDPAFMVSGPALTANADYFLRDGKPYPISGTTYMSKAAHREFLFAPNVANWDADFAAIKAAGANIVRTGLWMGWKRAMAHPGEMDEGVLRAFAAFLLTARKYELPVIFTFFAFIPETWGGLNAYCDPDAIRAQSEFVAAFARRFANVNHLLWDLINEPSVCNYDHLWSVRPNYDAAEQAAWADWLRAQAPDDEWRRRWRLTPDEPLSLPAMKDFLDSESTQDQVRPLRVMDYRRFGQEIFARWAAQMAAVIRANGNPHQLICVGQDEGGTKDSPSPWFHGPAMDFTSNHSWWQNDDLLWDSVVTKTPDRLNLMEETGIMFVDDVDGSPWRTPEATRDLLERKMALSLACGCAGFIQWLWNTNIYNNSNNEAGIGFHRGAGDEKPELQAFREVAAFFAANAERFVGRMPEEICIVIPHSNQYSVRNLADRATRRAVRTLEYRLGLSCRAIAEHRVGEIGAARLIVLPSPRVLTEACWQALLRQVEAGATLLATGFIEADEYWYPVPRLASFGLKTVAQPVARHETLAVNDGTLSATFPADLPQKAHKAVSTDGNPLGLQVIALGRGKLIYCPLPMELTGAEDETAALYRLAAEIAGFTCDKDDQPGILARAVHFAGSTLYLLVSESGQPEQVTLHGESWQLDVEVPAGRARMLFVDPQTGTVLSTYPEQLASVT